MPPPGAWAQLAAARLSFRSRSLQICEGLHGAPACVGLQLVRRFEMKLRHGLVAALGLCAAVLAADSARLTSLLEEFRERPSDWKLCNEIAAAYVADQKFDRAAEFYKKVTSLNAAFLPARKNLAVVLWFAGR